MLMLKACSTLNRLYFNNGFAFLLSAANSICTSISFFSKSKTLYLKFCNWNFISLSLFNKAFLCSLPLVIAASSSSILSLRILASSSSTDDLLYILLFRHLSIKLLVLKHLHYPLSFYFQV